MISAGEFRKGVTFEYENNIYTIVDFQHVKPGKGAAFVRTKMKNIVTGAVLEKTWNPTEKVQEATITTRNMTYSYSDGELYYFMDDEYNLTPLNYDQVSDALKWIKENDPVVVKSYKGVAFSVECENFVVLQVTQADPSVKGNTATNVMKDAVVETGTKIQVPMFVEEGEYIRIDTRTGEYMERVKK
ncbi:MAG TPA: elongation factor P [Clostridiales bacterium]|nr:elongation factor P [Clostridia bacterium]HCY52163.1 elongation factor P [Clostridiales bacterium]